jgi:hypothetical protein
MRNIYGGNNVGDDGDDDNKKNGDGDGDGHVKLHTGYF